MVFGLKIIFHSISFFDLLNARMALKSMTAISFISQKGKNYCKKAQAENLHIKVSCVPGHAYVEGIEKGCTATKNVAVDVVRVTPTRVIPHTDMKRPVLAALMVIFTKLRSWKVERNYT